MKMIMAWMALSLGAVQAAEPGLRLDLGSGIQMELIRVEPGTFTQGSPESEAGRAADESPRSVTISKPFYLGKFPVTHGQWERFANDSGYKTEAEKGQSGGYGWDGNALRQGREFTWKSPGFDQGENDPVTLVTWFDTQEYLKWLSKKTGRVCQLPSEAQWEYASRAGSTTAWPQGDDEMSGDAWAWHSGNASGRTHQIGKKQANDWGFQDMGGQVWEWCEDWYAPYAAGPVTDPLQTNERLSDKPRRVLRGGSFLKPASFSRSATRYRNDPRSRNADNGFRVMVLVADHTDGPVRADDPNSAVVPPVSLPPAPLGTPDGKPQPPSIPLPQPFSPVGQRSVGLSFLPMLVVAGIVLIFIVKFMTRRAYGPKTGSQTMPLIPSATRLTVQLADDGFWVKGNLRAGSPIAWKCVVNGEVKEGSTTYQPGPDGMLIFTGAHPDRAEAWPADGSYGNASGTYLNDLDSPSGNNFLRGATAGMIYERLHRDEGQSTPPPLPGRSSHGSSHSSFPSAY